MYILKSNDWLGNFNLIFMSIRQILFEFSDRFPDVDANGFIKHWKDFGQSFVKLLTTQYSSTTFYAGWDTNVEQIFILLKIFLANKGGRNGIANNATFVKACEKLMIFRKVHNMQ